MLVKSSFEFHRTSVTKIANPKTASPTIKVINKKIINVLSLKEIKSLVITKIFKDRISRMSKSKIKCLFTFW